MWKLAFQNFKASFKNYVSLIISLAFTILILLNFQNIIYSDMFAVLGEHNKRNINIVVQTVTVVLICFMFFFVGYATNVFLTKRKKEIGIYVFMGLSNQKIGKLYAIEVSMIGFLALILGLFFGSITTKLFQMIVLALSDIAIDLKIKMTWQPFLFTIGTYLILYLFFVIKGYINILRSSVLEMVSAARKNEYVQQKAWILIIKAILGLSITGCGYYLAIKESGSSVMENVLMAVVLVIVGVYLLFGGFIPLVVQALAKTKHFLYKKERVLWINNVIFRMKKNYRTYAIVAVLMLCSVTALATSFAMKMRYEKALQFRRTYTYQLLANQTGLSEQFEQAIEEQNTVKYQSEIPMLWIPSELVDTSFQDAQYVLVSYEKIKQAAEEIGLPIEVLRPNDDEIVALNHIYLLSLLIDKSNWTITINNKTYQGIDKTEEAYLGYFQEAMNVYVVNEDEYERLLPLGAEVYSYNYCIQEIDNFEASRTALEATLDNTGENFTSLIVRDPKNSDMEWVKILYSLGIFMFLVFTLASGSILFVKLYNDAFEEKERYAVLQKIGCSPKRLKRAIAHELFVTYTAPFLVMTVSSYFSVHALEKMMSMSLLLINVVSVGVILAVFFACYLASLGIYQKNVGLE